MSTVLQSVPFGVDHARIDAIYQREVAVFAAARPRSAALVERGRRSMPRGVPMAWFSGFWDHPVVYAASGAGATFTDVDGIEYLDFNLADSSTFCGFAPEPVAEAVARRMRSGPQLFLADENAIAVAEELARRFGLPKWQLTLSASQANIEAIRLARAATGRSRVLVFDGKYHGLIDDTLSVLDEGRVTPEYVGLPAGAPAETVIVPFNDAEAVAVALDRRDIACVITEPALTNTGIVVAEPGFHEAVRAACTRTGTVLIVDETHTLMCGFNGLGGRIGLQPDMVTVGKAIGGGVPFGAYGMCEPIADLMSEPGSMPAASGAPTGEIATGGTLAGSALQTAAARAALEHVLTQEAYQRTADLGARLADGIEDALASAGLPWSVDRLWAKSGYRPHPERPQNGADARARFSPPLSAAMRVWLANRGIWEAGWWSGPAVSCATTAADVDRYTAAFAELVDELAG